MSDANSAILDFLGLTGTVKSVENVVKATKQGVEVLNAWNALMATPDGQKFKKTLSAIIAGSSISADGALHIDAAPVASAATPVHEAPKPQVTRGHWEQGPWDPFAGAGWVWVPEK